MQFLIELFDLMPINATRLYQQEHSAIGIMPPYSMPVDPLPMKWPADMLIFRYYLTLKGIAEKADAARGNQSDQ